MVVVRQVAVFEPVVVLEWVALVRRVVVEG